MRIAPIFAQKGSLNAPIAPNQTFQMRSRRPNQVNNYANFDEAYFKLAEASMRDKKIELELSSMGLI